jgi:putative ABC transport system permease protein
VSAWRRGLARLGEFVSRRRIEREAQDEIRHHLDLLAEDFERRGLPRDEARRAARRAFGGVDQTMETVRDRRGVRALDTLARDVRAAARSLRRTPAFTAAAVGTLALGIGVNVAIFTIADAVLFRPLPYPEPGRLIALWETLAPQETGARGAASPMADLARLAVAPANLADYRARAEDLVTFAAYSTTSRSVVGDAGPEQVIGEAIMAGYFDVLGVAPHVGRAFRPDELVPGSDAVAVLSDGLWRRQLGAAPDALGRTIELGGREVRVIGIMPPDFEGASHPQAAVEFWVPAAFPPEILSGRGEHIVQVVGRLSPGATVDAVRERLRDVPALFVAEDARVEGLGVDAGPLRSDQVAETRPLFVALLLAVGVILLTACVNVTGLLVVRSIARGREVAVRVALGASRGRLLVAFATESAILAALGTAAGVGLGYWTMQALVAAAPPGIPHLDDISFGGRTLLFAALLAGLTTILVGVLPAWLASGTRPAAVLQSSGRGLVGAGLPRTRSVLLAGEVALSLALLVGAVLLSRSLISLNRVDLGFDPHDVLATRISLAPARYDDAARRLAFFEAVETRLRVTPGISDVAFANRLPLRGNWGSGFELHSPDGGIIEAVAGFQAVSTGYLATLRIPLRRGRWLERSDRANAPHVAVVNEMFGRDVLAGREPLGLRFRRHAEAPWVTIVGVIGDIRRGGRTADVEPQVYVPAAQTGQYPLWLLDVAVRAESDARGVEAAVRDVIWSVDPRQPVTLVRTLDETLALGQAEREFQTWLFLLFAGLALALALIGTYGAVSYAVSQRTAEIGLRMALGAGRADVLGWVAGRAAWPVAAGIAAGLAGAWFLSRSMTSLLFGIESTDPASYAAAAMLVALAATGASLTAGRSATRIDPAAVLR